MKYLLVLFAVVVVSATDLSELPETRKTCLTTNAISEETMKDIGNLAYPREENVMKYVLCVLDKMNFLDEKGLSPAKIASAYKDKTTEQEVTLLSKRCLQNYEPKDFPLREEMVFYQWTCMMEYELWKRIVKNFET